MTIFVPVEMTYENYTACTAPKDLLIVPGADHGMSYFMEPEKYENAVKAFWAKYDRPSARSMKFNDKLITAIAAIVVGVLLIALKGDVLSIAFTVPMQR